jgi:magnesium transporter
MITVTVCNHNKHFSDVEPNLKAILNYTEDKQNLVWVDVCEPTKEENEAILKVFSQHPLLLDFIESPDVRPKLYRFEDNLFLMIFYTISFTKEHAIETKKLTLVMGDNWLLTVHPERLALLDEAEKRWGLNTHEIERSIWVLVYSVLDTLVDSYSDIIDILLKHVDELESKLIHFSRKKIKDYANNKNVRPNYAVASFAAKKKLLTIRNFLVSAKDTITSFNNFDSQLHSKASGIYFDYVEDHISQMLGNININIEQLNSAVNANLAIISNDLNTIMRTLTATSIIIASGTLIAGIYGMNFEVMPELKWELGYPLALLVMVLVGVGIYLLLKWREWF